MNKCGTKSGLMSINRTLTEDQRKQLQKLWFIYGNNGKKHSHMNHRFIQNLLSRGEDDREFYLAGPANMREKGMSEEMIQQQILTQECIDAVDKILNDNAETTEL